MTTSWKKALTSCLSLALIVAGPIGRVSAETADLPDIGSPADAVLTKSEERQIGRMVLRGLREAGRLVSDPEINEYINDLGHRLVGLAHEGEHDFTFFVVADPAINAFALPGGYIGFNAGLILAAETESELAGVAAHEISHVTQNHIERQIYASSKASLISAAAMLAAILVGAATDAGGDAIAGAIAVGQGTAMQQQINFTRAHEYEADRVGIGLLHAAGFDPAGMPDFFETLGRRNSTTPGRVPEFLMTHPVTSARIAETRNRASKLEDVGDVTDSINFRLAQERLRVLNATTPSSVLSYYKGNEFSEDELAPIQYGTALALMASGDSAGAETILQELLNGNQGVIAYHSALAQAQMLSDKNSQSLETFERAIGLFPRNVPLTIRYSEALLRAGLAKEAHILLLDLLNNIYPTPEQARLIALAASAAGDTADAHYYMSEYHILNGDLLSAVHQLQLARAVPELDPVQGAKFQARLEEIMEYIPEKDRARIAHNSPVR